MNSFYMRNVKLQAMDSSMFAKFKVGGINTGDPTIPDGPLGLMIPISGSGTYNGSGYNYTGEISTCTGSGTTGSGIGTSKATITKEFMYDCDWQATITYDGHTKGFHGYFP